MQHSTNKPKRILIIGATSAIAKATARLYATLGYKLHLVARNEKALQATANDLSVRGASEVSFSILDVNHFEKHEDILRMAMTSLNRIDVALICHGSLPDQQASEKDFDLARHEINTNGLSVISLLTTLSGYFVEQEHGTIAVVTSVAGDRGRQSNYVYGSVKAMVSTYLQGLRGRLLPHNVHVVDIRPGFVDSPMTSHLEKGPLWSSPERIGKIIVAEHRKGTAYCLCTFLLAPYHVHSAFSPGSTFQAHQALRTSEKPMTDNKDSILYVDLDGTLINTDLLLESFYRLLAKNFLYLFVIPFWLLKGKANLKFQIARRVNLRVDLLPYNQKLISYLETEKSLGRQLVLISASYQSLVSDVAAHTGLFDQAIGSSERENIKGTTKLKKIQELSDNQPFDYAANASPDLKIWEQAESAIVVNGSKALLAKAGRLTQVAAVINSDINQLNTFLRALRIHQWAKNLLLFLPLLLSHQLNSIELILFSLAGFLSFSLCASSVYLLNDLLDLEHDRQHATKHTRPFAAGELSLQVGLIATPSLLTMAFLVATLLPWHFIVVLLGYYLLTVLYSFYLKAFAIIDVLLLACLYTIRIIAGAAAISTIPTFWLLAFSMFIFMSLAIVKRVAELENLRNQNEQEALGRGYRAADLESLTMLGSASGFMAVLVFALYINAEETRILYGTPEILWFICPLLLYLVSRVWLLTNRGQLHEDPVVFFITDHSSQVVAVLCGLLVWAATRSWF